MRRSRRPRKLGIGILLAGVLSSVIPLLSEKNPQNESLRTSTESFAADSRSSSVSKSGGLSGKVIRVLDGDTVELLLIDGTRSQPVRVRMTGIDAPEKKQPFGQACRKHLADLVAGRQVGIDVRGTDRYSRTLGVVVIPGSKQDVNLAQVSAGCAWHYKQYQKQQLPQERLAYAAAEVLARKEKRGLWHDPEPQAPWEFRRQGRSR